MITPDKNPSANSLEHIALYEKDAQLLHYMDANGSSMFFTAITYICFVVCITRVKAD